MLLIFRIHYSVYEYFTEEERDYYVKWNHTAMRTACFTVDLDRDVNFLPDGCNKAASLDRGHGTVPRFSSSAKGAEIICEVLEETGIKATFFAETTTLQQTKSFNIIGGNEIAVHGVDHEDVTIMSDDEIRTMLGTASDAITQISGKEPKGFRAPFMKFDERLADLLKEAKISYDSSTYGNKITEIKGIKEVPVSQGTDREGKRMYAYLWPMHERKRSPDDYIEMASKNELFVFATHTWHMVESRERGLMSAQEIQQNKAHLAHIIFSLLDAGFEFKEMKSLI